MIKKTDKNGIETYFEWYLNELSALGYVKHYSRESKSFVVRNESEYGELVRFKRKSPEIKQFNLFPKITYTPDYFIEWTPLAEYFFFEEVNFTEVFQFGKPLFVAHRGTRDNGESFLYSYVDVKPTNSVVRRGGRVSSSVSFPFKQRMLWEQEKVYINKVVPIPMAGTGFNSALFVKSFVPQRYLLTDGGRQIRKIQFKLRTLNEYISKTKADLDTILKNTK